MAKELSIRLSIIDRLSSFLDAFDLGLLASQRTWNNIVNEIVGPQTFLATRFSLLSVADVLLRFSMITETLISDTTWAEAPEDNEEAFLYIALAAHQQLSALNREEADLGSGPVKGIPRGSMI